ncbi:MAG: hypothetical protein ACJ0F6_00090 [Acidimicrobiales bacterium]
MAPNAESSSAVRSSKGDVDTSVSTVFRYFDVFGDDDGFELGERVFAAPYLLGLVGLLP